MQPHPSDVVRCLDHSIHCVRHPVNGGREAINDLHDGHPCPVHQSGERLDGRRGECVHHAHRLRLQEPKAMKCVNNIFYLLSIKHTTNFLTIHFRKTRRIIYIDNIDNIYIDNIYIDNIDNIDNIYIDNIDNIYIDNIDNIYIDNIDNIYIDNINKVFPAGPNSCLEWPSLHIRDTGT